MSKIQELKDKAESLSKKRNSMDINNTLDIGDLFTEILENPDIFGGGGGGGPISEQFATSINVTPASGSLTDIQSEDGNIMEVGDGGMLDFVVTFPEVQTFTHIRVVYIMDGNGTGIYSEVNGSFSTNNVQIYTGPTVYAAYDIPVEFFNVQPILGSDFGLNFYSGNDIKIDYLALIEK